MSKNKINTKYLPFYIIATLITIFFVLSLILFLTHGFGKRKVFIFPSVEQTKVKTEGQEIYKAKYVLEYRNLKEYKVLKDKKLDKIAKSAQPEKNDYYIRYYIDELLLGSGVERTKKLFAQGTKVNSCFVRDDVIYLDLSSDLLQPGNDTVNIDEGVVLLEKNIKKNFPGIKEVKLFVDGKMAFEN